MNMSGITPPSMDWESSNLPEAWEKFKRHTELVFKGPLKDKSEEERIAYVLLWIGDKGRDVYQTWQLTDEENKSLAEHYKKFQTYVQPKLNPVFARFRFYNEIQGADSVDKFITRLRLRAQDCQFKDKAIQEEMIRDRIVIGTNNTRIREKLINEGEKLTLDKAIQIAQSFEYCQHQMASMNITSNQSGATSMTATPVDAIARRKKGPKQRQKQQKQYPQQQQQHRQQPCDNCGNNHGPNKHSCPAFGKRCRKCQRLNHFAFKCRSQQRAHKSVHDIDSSAMEGACGHSDSGYGDNLEYYVDVSDKTTDGTGQHDTRKEGGLDNDADQIQHVELESETSVDDYERGVWGRKLEFILSVIGYSVGVGNLWRFPYLVMQNGGGAFLIPYFFFLLLCGVPLFYLELCLGQFSGTSCLFVWKICPLFKGVGYMMLTVSFVYCWYYIMVLVWVCVYFVNSFLAELPWSRCGQAWNSDSCIAGMHVFKGSAVCNDTGYCVQNTTTAAEGSDNATASMANTASKEFWHHYVLDKSEGLEDFGTVQWHLAIALVCAWIVIFLCLMKGIKSVGKVVYVTALLPYVLLTVFLIKGLTLPGALDGIKYYITPDFRRLLDGQVWLQAAVQVFYSLGPAWGGLITMASYNKFNNNCLRDAVICCAADGFTSFYGGFVIFSVIGYVAHGANLEIHQVATSGPGLALVIYPEAITKLPIPQLWAALFFLMLLCLGIDSQFGVFETLSSGLTDMFPKLRKHKTMVCACLCVLIMLLDIPYTTNGGIYLYQLVDWYFAAFCVVVISFLECFVVAWVYGANRFSRDVCLMTGSMPPILFRICWCFVTPLAMFVTFVIMCINYEPPTYDGYVYPVTAKVFGNILAMVPIIPLPLAMVYEIYHAEGTIMERIRFLLKPSPDWGPRVAKYRDGYAESYTMNTTGFLDSVKHNLLSQDESS